MKTYACAFILLLVVGLATAPAIDAKTSRCYEDPFGNWICYD